MGMLMGGFLSQGGGAPVITVSGESVTHITANGTTARAAIIFRFNDGTVDRIRGTAVLQIDSATDWRIPNGLGTGYYWKYTMLGFPSYNPGSLAANTWYEITADRTIGAEAASNNTQNTHSIVISVADAASDANILDSASYSCSATQGLPP